MSTSFGEKSWGAHILKDECGLGDGGSAGIEHDDALRGAIKEPGFGI